jgi:hypothetical protein
MLIGTDPVGFLALFEPDKTAFYAGLLVATHQWVC